MCFLASHEELQTVHECCGATLGVCLGTLRVRGEVRQAWLREALGEEGQERNALGLRRPTSDVIERHGLVQLVEFQDTIHGAVEAVGTRIDGAIDALQEDFHDAVGVKHEGQR